MDDRRPSEAINDVHIRLSPHDIKGPNVIAVGPTSGDRRRSILAPTTTQAYTKRQQKPSCSMDALLWLPFTLIKYVLIAVGLIIWFTISVIFGILLLPISPRWIFRFFRDLCNLPMSEDEKVAAEIEIVALAKDNIVSKKFSPIPGCPMHPHAFSHALAMARFNVEEGLSSDLRVGLFSRVNSWDAIVRFSGATGPPDENDNGIHGMAVKLVGVDETTGTDYQMWNDTAVKDEKEKGITGERYDNKTVAVDFIGATAGPTFFAKNLREILWVTKIQRNYWWCIYLPGLRVFWRLLYTQPKINKFLNENRGPLGWTYVSWLPHRFGQHFIKYHWLPDQIGAWQMPLRTVQYPSQKAIKDHLLVQSASYGLYVQFQPLPSDPHYAQFPLEDATVEWDQKIAPLHRVATLTIPPQDIDTPQRWYMGHTLAYNPSQTFAEHAPVGSVNNSRHRIYHVSSMERMSRLNLKSIPKCPFISIYEKTQLPYGELIPQSVATATNVHCSPEPEIPKVKVIGPDGYETKVKKDTLASPVASTSTAASSSPVKASPTVTPSTPSSPPKQPTVPSTVSNGDFIPAAKSPPPGLKILAGSSAAPLTPNGPAPAQIVFAPPIPSSPDTRPTKARVSVTRGGATTVGATPPSPVPTAHGTPILSPSTHFKLGPAAAPSGTPPGPRTAVVYLEE